MTVVTRRARWAALEAVWTDAAATSAQRPLGSLPWQTLGSCCARPELPWTAEPEQVGPWEAETMRSVCAACPVLSECGTAATELDAVAGWWAGAHRDPDYVEPPAPTWVPLTDADIEQGVLPLDLGGVA